MNCGSTRLNKCIDRLDIEERLEWKIIQEWACSFICVHVLFFLDEDELLLGIWYTPSWTEQRVICWNDSKAWDLNFSLVSKLPSIGFGVCRKKISPIRFYRVKKTWATNLKTYYYKVTYARMLSGENIFFVVQIMPLFANSLLTYHSRTDCPLTSPQCTFASLQLDCDHAESV